MIYKIAFECFCTYVKCRFWSWKLGLYAKIARVLCRVGEWCVENSDEDYVRKPILITQLTDARDMHKKLIDSSVEWRVLAKISYEQMKQALACL